MKVKITRTTRPKPGNTLGHTPEVLFAELALNPENVVKLLCLRPPQLLPAPVVENGDRCWIIKDPLMFHTLVTNMAHRHRHSEKIEQFITLLDLMGPHLADKWELSWDTMTDMELEIHTDYQGVRF